MAERDLESRKRNLDDGKEDKALTSSAVRKIEFDKGMPLSFDFASNEVHTYNEKKYKVILQVFKKVLLRPLYLMNLFLYIVSIIAVSKDSANYYITGGGYLIILHIFLTVIEIVFELYSYFLAYSNDSKINSQPAFIYDDTEKVFIEATWKDIRVGHVIKVQRDEIVPADIIILETMDSNHSCYIDKSSIKGVFDRFIVKKSCVDTRTPSLKNIKFSEYIKNIKGMIKCEEPNSEIYNFNARLKLEIFPRASDVTNENFVMRGCTIKNVKCIYGLVIYTGMETKIMQILKIKNNQDIIKTDRNIIHKSFRVIHYFLIGLLALICLMFTLSLINKKYLYKNFQINFFGPDYMSDTYWGIFQFLLTFQLYIPYIWYNLIYVAYYIISIFIQWDVKVRQKEKYIIDIINKNSLCDFGNVKYILTDKTGTLTSRKFTLKACSIKGKLYSVDPLDKKDDNYIFRMKNFDINDLELYQDLTSSNNTISEYIRTFFEFLSVCHSVKIKDHNKPDNLSPEKEKIYGYTFAEEKATLKAFANFGYKLIKTKNNKIVIEVNGETRPYYVVGENTYSNRNRMSIILKRNKKDLESLLICKGYDDSIFKLIKNETSHELNLIKDQISKLSQIGYRYVIYCSRILGVEETATFTSKFKLAENYALGRELLYENLAVEYETDMYLLGVLFFEEKVSSDLRYSIAKLNNSGINVWVVSGDRKENVVAVSKNLEMIKNNNNVIEFDDSDDIDSLDIKLNQILHQLINKESGQASTKQLVTRGGKGFEVESNSGKNQEIIILISGPCFDMICSDSRLNQCFSIMLCYVNSLFAYEFTVYNKYQLCKIVKQFVTLNSKVLAIGDGLNDFMMLKEADLSIGIYSKEILQVSNTCDIIVSKFSQIVDLILVHGSWNLNRFINIAFFSIYANFIIILPVFIYQSEISIDSAFFYLDALQLVLKLLIINLSVIFMLCFDQFVERPLIGINTMLYNENFKNTSEVLIFSINYLVMSIIDAFIIYFITIYTMRVNINSIGNTTDIYMFGETLFINSFLVIFIKLFCTLNSITIISLITFIIASILTIAVYLIYGTNTDLIISMYQGLGFVNIVLSCLFTLMFIFIIFFIYSSFNYIFNPTFIQLLVQRYENFIEEYMIFINFEDNIKSLTNLFVKTDKAKNKITYIDVIEKMTKSYKQLDSVIDNLTDLNNDKISKMKIKQPSLVYVDEKLEKDFNIHHSHILVNSFYVYQATLILLFIIDISIEATSLKLSKGYSSKILNGVMIVIGLVLHIPKIKENFFRYFIIYYYAYIIAQVIIIFSNSGSSFSSKIDDLDVVLYVQNIIIFLYPLLVANKRFYNMILGVVVYLLAVISGMYYINFHRFLDEIILDPFQNMNSFYFRSLFIISNIFFIMIFGYNEELESKISYIKYNKKSLDLKKDQEIFNNLVPEFIQGKMKSGNKSSSEIYEYETVTIIFCDISDFENLVASQTAKDLITLLDKVYNTFDQLCALHGIQKIETVGKTYMGCGGLREIEKDIDEGMKMTHHAIRTFELSLDMIDIMQRMTLENGEIVRIKIGIHTGKVIPAVVGNHKPQFSLIGDTVNTSARMCSYSSDLCVMLSEHAYEFVGTKYTDFALSEKFVKGKGNMKLYLHNPNKNKINNDVKLDYGKTKKFQDTQWIKKTTIRAALSIKNNNQFANKLVENNKEREVREKNVNETKELNEKEKDEVKKEEIVEENKTDEVRRLAMKDDRREDTNKDFTKKESIMDVLKYADPKKDDKANASISQQSVFIFENSQDMPQNGVLNNNQTTVVKTSNSIRDEKKKTDKLRKSMIFAIGPQQKESHKEGENIIFQNSFFFLKFYNDGDIPETDDEHLEESNIPRDIYRVYLSKLYKKTSNFFYIINLIYIFIILLGIYNSNSNNNLASTEFLVYTIFRVIIMIFLGLILALTKKIREKEALYKSLIFFVYLSMTIINQVQSGKIKSNHDFIDGALEQHLTILITCLNGILNFRLIIIELWMYIIIFIINLASNYSYLTLKFYITSIFISLTMMVYLTIREYIATLDYLNNKKKTEDLNQKEKLLFNLMPSRVVENLKEDILVVDEINNVTMLFADICKFTDYSSERDPSQVVEMLKSLFYAFDEKCIESNVYKVHTIGDCYVVMSYTGKVKNLDRNPVEEAGNVFRMGQHMINIIKEVGLKVNFTALDMRIGIHTGNIIAGIIGTKVVRYDIFGSDVLIANKMESSGKIGRINVSEETRKFLERDTKLGKLNFEAKIPVKISSLNKEIDSYLVIDNTTE